MSVQSATLHDLAEQASRIADRCPADASSLLREKHLRISGTILSGFLKDGARWTETALIDPGFGSETWRRINWSLLAMEKGQPAGDAYRKLVGMIRDGFDLVRKRVPPALSGPVKWPAPGHPRAQEYPSVEHYVQTAQDTVRKHLLDPYARWDWGKLRSPIDVWTEPFVSRILDLPAFADDIGLRHAQWCLSMALESALMLKAVTLNEIRPFLLAGRYSGIDSTEWQTCYDQLDAVLTGTDARDAAPWFWLGVNLLGYRGPGGKPVFEKIDPKVQTSMSFVFSPDTVSGVPSFVDVIRDALRHAGGMVKDYVAPKDLVSRKYLTSELDMAAGTISTYNSAARRNPDDLWNSVVVFDNTDKKRVVGYRESAARNWRGRGKAKSFSRMSNDEFLSEDEATGQTQPTMQYGAGNDVEECQQCQRRGVKFVRLMVGAQQKDEKASIILFCERCYAKLSPDEQEAYAELKMLS